MKNGEIKIVSLFVSMLYINKLIRRVLLNLEFVVCTGRYLDELNSDGVQHEGCCLLGPNAV
jgi:hypothetical protein